eukprot:gene29633-38756_t
MNQISAASFSTFPPHVVVPMPALSPTMETGSISRWNLKEGDKFEAGTAICEVETDKATVTFDATEEGYLAKILVGTGEIKVGQPIMVTVEDKESVAALSSFSLGTPPAPAPVAVPVAAPSSSPAPSTPSPSPSSSSSRVFASPLAKKLAREAGLDLGTVVQRLGQGGSGPNGRLIAEDVLRAAALPASAPVAVAAAQAPIQTPTAVPSPSIPSSSSSSSSSGVVTVPGQFSDYPLGDLSLDLVVPHYYLSVDLDLTELLALRAKLNGTIKSGSGGRELSVLDFLVKAAALAVKQVAWRVSPVVTATLSCDHRVVDGAVGAQWLAAFKALAENPMAMIL